MHEYQQILRNINKYHTNGDKQHISTTINKYEQLSTKINNDEQLSTNNNNMKKY